MLDRMLLSISQVHYCLTYVDDIRIETCGSNFAPAPLKAIKKTTISASLGIYPNPADAELFLELNDIISVSMKKANILSALGQVISTHKLGGTAKARLDISDLPGGQTYLIIIETEDGSSFVEKFVKI